ncbi:MAG: S8 family serine peptidase [Akkermansiaceae bacterium]|jgi:hypothetical protein
MPVRHLIIALTLTIGGLIAWLLVNDIAGRKSKATVAMPTKKVAQQIITQPRSDRQLSDRSADDWMEAMQAIPNERIVSFKSEEAYQDFLKRLAGSNLRNLGQIDVLRAIRLGYDDLADFDALGLDPDDLDYNFPVTIPPRAEVDAQNGIVGFGRTALEFLGINGDNSTWGTGVKIAVIDTGIEPHLALNKNIQYISLVELGEGVAGNSHGTSVASLIAGNHPSLLGVAPGADLISIRVADETGYSNSFLLAQGIIEAVLSGAQVINISMGSNNDSSTVANAVKYAIKNGVVIIASPGNDGLTQSSYPARYEGVVSVGAVDSLGQHLNFSHTDQNMSASAPGLQITAAYPGDMVTDFSGTSASAPFFSGAVAAVMSQSSTRISGQEAVNILLNTTNEAGDPGQDSKYGNGILDVGRAINSSTPGITDLAVASQTYLLPRENSSSSGLQVSVENRGTEAVWNSVLTVSIASGEYPVQVNSLQPNERKVITIPVGLQQLEQVGFLDVRSQITLSGDATDAKPSNDARTEQVTLPSNGP